MSPDSTLPVREVIAPTRIRPRVACESALLVLEFVAVVGIYLSLGSWYLISAGRCSTSFLRCIPFEWIPLIGPLF